MAKLICAVGLLIVFNGGDASGAVGITCWIGAAAVGEVVDVLFCWRLLAW